MIPKLNPASGIEHGIYSAHKCQNEIYRSENLPLFRGFPLFSLKIAETKSVRFEPIYEILFTSLNILYV